MPHGLSSKLTLIADGFPFHDKRVPKKLSGWPLCVILTGLGDFRTRFWVKEKHIRIRIEQCLALAKASNCPRRTFGALLLDPERNVVLMDGYNGGPRGGGKLCGGEECLRETLGVQSGTRMEIGCHHAEMNVICNAAANGVRTRGAWLIVTGEPCMMCAKLIHHSGITRVLVVDGGNAGANGCDYLESHKVEVMRLEGPQDPRIGSS